MRRVIVESPYQANEYRSIEQHKLYLLHALDDCVRRGEAPFASHLLLPEILDDRDPVERGIGIKAGWVWGEHADVIACYSQLGVSPGMKESIAHYKDKGIPIEWRAIEDRIVRDILASA
jgi:hypothetical protein